MSSPAQGMRITLERVSAEPVVYRGQIEAAEASFPLAATVTESDASPDGLVAEAQVTGFDDARRAELERVVATMLRSAVRGARKDGRAPPRRIQRWRA